MLSSFYEQASDSKMVDLTAPDDAEHCLLRLGLGFVGRLRVGRARVRA